MSECKYQCSHKIGMCGGDLPPCAVEAIEAAKAAEALKPSHNKCEQCEHYDISQGVYTVECYSCKRYCGDMFTLRVGA